MSTLAVVETILRDAAVPLSVRELVERAGEALPTKSKTPDTVVARDLSMDIKKKGESSLFIRTSPGRYAIREQVMRERQLAGEHAAAAAPPVFAPEQQQQQQQATPILGPALNKERAPARPATTPPVVALTEEMSV